MSVDITRRPRQACRDCVVIVFREITGEDENTALFRFRKYLNGRPGLTMADLSSCFTEAGWMMIKDDREIPLEEAAFSEFWKKFQGQGILSYSVEGAEVGHCVVVRSGGVVFDPVPTAPEEGEFILKHFKQYCGPVTIQAFSTVFKP
jgi:hypothetical protein